MNIAIHRSVLNGSLQLLEMKHGILTMQKKYSYGNLNSVSKVHAVIKLWALYILATLVIALFIALALFAMTKNLANFFVETKFAVSATLNVSSIK